MQRSLIILSSLLLFILFNLFYSISIADMITLKDGTMLTCVIVLEDTKTLVIETRFGSMSLHRIAVTNIGRDSSEKNLLLRGDFCVARNDYTTAMKYYSDALTQYPASKEVREKYRQLRDLMDKSTQKELAEYGKQSEKPELDITPENKEVAEKHIKTKKKEPITTLILYGFGAYPAEGSKSSKGKTAIDSAKRDALKKAFGDAVGIGFTLTKGKVKIFASGELPKYQIKILEKQKVEGLGYTIKLQVQCPPSSLLFKIPEEVKEQEVIGSVSISDTKQKDYKTAALQEAYRQAVLNAIATQEQYKNKPELSGRLFLIEPPSGDVVSGFYQVKIRVRVWFDL